jgi:tetratricopeptide (TPR) repeat protein
MKRWRTIVVALAAAVLIPSPPLFSWSGASGVHSVIALFESHVHPDLPFDRFAAGRLGIVKPTWDRSYLYAAYRYLAGPGFDPSEQKALVSLWKAWLGLGASGSSQSTEDQQNAAGKVTSEWIMARNKVPGVEAIEEIDVDRQAPAEYGSFDYANCNESSFHTAAATLDTMIGKFGLSSPQVKQWVDAQDQVFNNCSGTLPKLADDSQEWFKASEAWFQLCKTVPGVVTPGAYGEGDNCRARKYQTLTAALETMIHHLGASNPKVKQWVDEQNKALVACGSAPHFGYENPTPLAAPEIPQPLTGGMALENAQRTYQIASANFYAANFDTAAKMFDAIAADSSSPWRHFAPYLVARAMIRKATLSAEKNDHAGLAQAEAQLNKIVATSHDDGVKRAAQRLLGFVDAQLHPEQREEELARAVMLSTPAEVLKQDVSDYIWMQSHGPSKGNSYSDDLTDWISSLHRDPSNDPAAQYFDTASIAHSLAKWKQTSSLPWLVASMSEIPATDPNAPILIKAAEEVKPDSPAFATVTYHAARLLAGQGKADEARRKLDAILARRDEQPVSTVNELAALRMTLARNLNELLVDARRTPLGITDDGDSEELPTTLDDPKDQSLKELAAEPMFDDDGAAVLTRWVPLSVMMQAARSQTLPPSLRAQVALATFVRAILLGNDGAARDLAPAVMESNPKLKPPIDAWLDAKSPDAKRFAAAFMMLQNPGLRFYVDPGPGRDTALDEMDSLRDNWWPSWVGQNLQTQTYPSFLSATERKSADEEWRKLSSINAPNFLCGEAIEQAKSNPTDERAPEALYQCTRAVHLGCSNVESTGFAKSAFVLLHRRYPDSSWAEKGKVWYKGNGGCNSVPTS